MTCANCYQPITEIVRVNCNEPLCLWGLVVCVPCYKNKIGDGTQPAVIAARQHATMHCKFMLVRLNESSDTRGQLIGHVRNEQELQALIKDDLQANGPADYLVHDVKSKNNVRVNVKSAPQVFDGKKT